MKCFSSHLDFHTMWNRKQGMRNQFLIHSFMILDCLLKSKSNHILLHFWKDIDSFIRDYDSSMWDNSNGSEWYHPAHVSQGFILLVFEKLKVQEHRTQMALRAKTKAKSPEARMMMLPFFRKLENIDRKPGLCQLHCEKDFSWLAHLSHEAGFHLFKIWN